MARTVNNVISQSEFEQFMSISPSLKAEAMEAYLIKGYKMADVGELLYDNPNYSFTVSLIHRCYNFSNKNAGRYKENSAFQKKYNYRVTRRDIEDFINQYPQGTFRLGISFEDFLLDKIRRLKQNQNLQNQNTHFQNYNTFQESSYTYHQNPPSFNQSSFHHAQDDSFFPNNQAAPRTNYGQAEQSTTNDDGGLILAVIGSIIFYALIFYVFRKPIFRFISRMSSSIFSLILKVVFTIAPFAIGIIIFVAVISGLIDRFKYR